jgi:hypothetical protein
MNNYINTQFLLENSFKEIRDIVVCNLVILLYTGGELFSVANSFEWGQLSL